MKPAPRPGNIIAPPPPPFPPSPYVLTCSSSAISSCLWCSLASLRVSATSVPSVLRLHSSTLPALDLGGKENEDKLEFSVLQEQPWMSSNYRWGQVWPNKHASTLAHTVRRVLTSVCGRPCIWYRGWRVGGGLAAEGGHGGVRAAAEAGHGRLLHHRDAAGGHGRHHAARGGPPGLQLWALYRAGRRLAR